MKDKDALKELSNIIKKLAKEKDVYLKDGLDEDDVKEYTKRIPSYVMDNVLNKVEAYSSSMAKEADTLHKKIENDELGMEEASELLSKKSSEIRDKLLN